MTRSRLNKQQTETYWTNKTHGYGLGVRCKKENGLYNDFGWGGAAGAYLAIDPTTNLSLYFSTHLLCCPVQGLRPLILRFINAELFGTEKIENIYKELKDLYNYNLTY
jgi:hypothetical protein